MTETGRLRQQPIPLTRDPACSGKVVVTSSATVVTPSSSSGCRRAGEFFGCGNHYQPLSDPSSSSAIVPGLSPRPWSSEFQFQCSESRGRPSSSKAVVVLSSLKAVVVSSSSGDRAGSSSATATSSSSAASGTAAITMSYGGTYATFTAGVTYSITLYGWAGSLVCSGSGTVACGSSAAVTLSSWDVKIGEYSECAQRL